VPVERVIRPPYPIKPASETAPFADLAQRRVDGFRWMYLEDVSTGSPAAPTLPLFAKEKHKIDLFGIAPAWLELL
jgi:hypothetical protein